MPQPRSRIDINTAGIASALPMAQLSEAGPGEELVLSIGGGAWDGRTALAAGLSGRINQTFSVRGAALQANDSFLADVECRVRKHLRPVFGGRRMASITTTDVQRFVARRQAANASNGEINRELTTLKRMFSLSLQGGTLLTKPHIPLLHEDNVRKGFFDHDQFEAVVQHLPDDLAPMLRVAYITGWRVRSEIQPLQWRQVDFAACEVRLDPGTTKNKQGRTFPFTNTLREVLVSQRAVADELQRTTGTICPWVFHRQGRPIKTFVTAWRRACARAGCPGKIPHDLRRTAVRNLIRAGISEPVAMTLTGHLTRSVFDRTRMRHG